MGDISNERSMEDILSSIKRIIAEEGEPGQRPRRPRSSPPTPASQPEVDEAAEDDTVLELAAYADEPEPEPAYSPEPEAVEAVDAPQPAAPEVEPDHTILSRRAADATRGSLEALSKLVVKPQTHGAETLEGLVREMLRPMLSDWLDAHLPEIVERIVQREVERLTQR